ncbi:cAMP-binding domain of CRP or a regulatory subunit of cAMP-dependent protein kinases [Singulisphaera sp. GP187]|uniref:Crp/Fnr family transcriptional regulator n=1 Tax=Singulisphaera sp. GP187 TaxID=1882752 RepID=UPI0009266FCF|nr:cyclic nucleotide-binding domain-containing protein [Singulisphaera sp. GP187]SIO28717.1 cAMP-binding domain of CRP or a regulatory subunit of cAMP-dependent protein kinases [Singulisphaera sp. GP187]
MVTAAVAEQFLVAPLLVDVELDAKRALLAMLEESHAPAGAVLLEQGEPNDHLSFLIEGSAVIERALPGGRKEILANLHAPAVFGTTSFFRPTPPTITVRASTDVCILTMGHPAHDLLRQNDPRTAESLALAVVRVLAERFDLLDKRVSDFLAQHADDQPKTTEWSGFRARLFEDTNI